MIVQKPDILVHIEDVLMRQTFDILRDVHDLLEVLVLSVVEDRIVHNDAVNTVIMVCCNDGLLHVVFANYLHGVLEATVPALVLTLLSRRKLTYFSLHDLSVHSAYTLAEGSSLANMPSR